MLLPMFATCAKQVPSGSAWVHEVKWDGMRVLAEVSGGRLHLYTRTGADATDRFPELHQTLSALPDVVLDGEVVILTSGRPSFAALSERIHVHDRATAVRMAEGRPVTYLAFDVLRYQGHTFLEVPWQARRGVLEALPVDGATVQVPATHDDGAALFEATAEVGLEGVISKRRDGGYQPGRRTAAWLKIPHRASRSFVIGGWRWMDGSAGTLGSVLVGQPTGQGLVLAGRVGSGLIGRAGVSLLATLEPLRRQVCPFLPPVPKADSAGTVWVHPEVVIDVYSLGSAAQGRLRQPSYHRIRPDLSVIDLLGEPGDSPR